MAKERYPGAFLLGAAIGGVIGGVYGLLNAPRSGDVTRANLTERWHELEDQTERKIAGLETEVSERVDQVAGGATMDRPARA
jgi:gas vesicle protein